MSEHLENEQRTIDSLRVEWAKERHELMEEIARLKGLIEEAWHQSLINCEMENGSYEGDGHYVHLREFKQINLL